MKLASHFIIAAFIVFSLNSCKNIGETERESTLKSKEITAQTVEKATEIHWSYSGDTGPEYWSQMEGNTPCDGLMQSPVDIETIKVVEDEDLKPLDIHYKPETKMSKVTNNGHSIQYNFEEGDYVTIGDARYNLKQIHFHESSEHTINGVRFPMAIHLVHASDNGKIAVLGVMVKEGEPNAPFEFLETFLPLKSGESKTINAGFDMNKNLPINKGYYHYTGSLITPPCTESVAWYIFKEPSTISKEQVVTLRKNMPLNNYRNEQKLNGRIITMTND